MFHQLECLEVLRRSYLSKTVTEATRECFNYLEQVVLCHGDTRLESVRWLGKPHIISVVGDWECREWDALYRALDEGMVV